MNLTKLLLNEADDDVEVPGPNFWFRYKGKKYPAWSSPKGRMKTVDYDLSKFNRYAKIGDRANELLSELKSIIKNKPKSIEARSAYAALLMMEHGIRTGNESSAEGYMSGLEENEGELVKTFGVSTLLPKHVEIKDGNLELNFLGKTQVEHRIKVLDPFMVKYGRFYLKHKNKFKTWLGIDYYELYKFIRNQVGEGFVPKDFRTFRGNTAAWDWIEPKLGRKVETKTDANEVITQMVEHAASVLGNTPSVCRSSYLDSRMLDWIKDELIEEPEDD